jgi:hypothetical protein
MNRHVLALLCALAVASPALGGLASAYAAAPPPTVEWTFGVYGTLGATAVNSQGRLIVASTSDDWIYITEIGADGQPLRQYTELSPGTTITAIALDHKDNVYVVGYTRDFYFNARGGVVDEHPTTKIFGFFDLDAFVNAGVLFATGGLYTPGVKGILSSSENGFLFKVSADLTRRLYGTFLGGDGNIGGFGSPFPGSNFIVKKITGLPHHHHGVSALREFHVLPDRQAHRLVFGDSDQPGRTRAVADR